MGLGNAFAGLVGVHQRIFLHEDNVGVMISKRAGRHQPGDAAANNHCQIVFHTNSWTLRIKDEGLVK
jgi:hypothetical protein